MVEGDDKCAGLGTAFEEMSPKLPVAATGIGGRSTGATTMQDVVMVPEKEVVDVPDCLDAAEGERSTSLCTKVVQTVRSRLDRLRAERRELPDVPFEDLLELMMEQIQSDG